MPEQKKTVIVDSQILTTFTRCEREFDYRFLQVLEAVDKEENLEVGSLMHVMLKVYYCLKRASKFTHKECTNLAVEIASVHAIKSEVDVAYTEELAEHFRLYAEHYQYETWIPLNVEEPFSFILYEDDELRIIYYGVMDLFIENFGEQYPVDHKTERRTSDPLELDNQFLGYCAATGKKVLYVNKVGLQVSKKPAERFRRVPVSYTTDRINEWKAVSVYRVKQYLHALEEHAFPPRYVSCLRFNKKCRYYDLCNTDRGDARNWKAQEKFSKGQPWNPYTRDDELDKIIEQVIASK